MILQRSTQHLEESPPICNQQCRPFPPSPTLRSQEKSYYISAQTQGEYSPGGWKKWKKMPPPPTASAAGGMPRSHGRCALLCGGKGYRLFLLFQGRG